MDPLSRLLVFASVALLLGGCAPVISKQTLATVDRGLEFNEVIREPDAYAGRSVVFGGTILGVENMDGRTVVEVLQERLNSQLKPVDPEESAGRFLVEFDGFKDPVIYSTGNRLTAAGEITGVERRKLGKATYAYPVLKPREHYLWGPRPYDPGPRIGIGIGLGYTRID